MRVVIVFALALAAAACDGFPKDNQAAFEACRALISEHAQWGLVRVEDVDAERPNAALPKGERRHVLRWAAGEVVLWNGFGAQVPFSGSCDTEVVAGLRRVRIRLQSPQSTLVCERWESEYVSRERRARDQEFYRLIGRDSAICR